MTELSIVSPDNDRAVAPRSDILIARPFTPRLPPGTENAAMIGSVSADPCPPLYTRQGGAHVGTLMPTFGMWPL